jgi:UDP-N-acetylglucosamine--dolichyl-phosphate N-acetylglucosaminephosphotransferase
MYLIIPFISCALPLFLYNRYPSRVFVGDTFCYFAGMTFAVVGILGHFSKFLLLFFIPQIFNFVLSVPQLFKFIPCPRHRLPRYVRAAKIGKIMNVKIIFKLLFLKRYNKETDLLEPSTVEFQEKDLKFLSKLIFRVFRFFGLIKVNEKVNVENNKKLVIYESSNFTIINFYLIKMGPTKEGVLTRNLMIIQVIFLFTIIY